MRQDDDGQVRAIVAKRADQLRAFLGVPAAEQCRKHFAAVRPLKQRKRHFLVCGADDAPAGAAGNR